MLCLYKKSLYLEKWVQTLHTLAVNHQLNLRARGSPLHHVAQPLFANIEKCAKSTAEKQ